MSNQDINNYIYLQQNLKNPLITDKKAIVFELLEIISLLFLVIFYFKKNTFLCIAFLIPLIEHIRQLFYSYRQKPKSMIANITIFFHLIVFIYSFYNKYWLSSFFSAIGFFIHLFQIITNRSFISIVSYKDIIKIIT